MEKIEILEKKLSVVEDQITALKAERREEKSLYDKLKSHYSFYCEDCPDKQPFKTRNSFR